MSFKQHDFFAEVRKLMMLAFPLMGAQLVMCLAGFVDTLMAGHYSSTDLAAVAVGYTCWIPVNVFLVGLLIAKTAFVAQLTGAGQQEDIPALVHQGLYLAAGAGLTGLVLLYQAPHLLPFTGLSEQAGIIATHYIHAVAFGMPGVAINQVLRSYMEGQGHTRSVMVIQVLSLALNIPFNYAMIYGKFGFPEMGGVGCGYATALIMWLAPVLMSLYIKYNRKCAKTTPWRTRAKVDQKKIRELISIGTPIGCTLFLQFLVFTVITLLVTPMGETVVGAHQIAFNFSTLPFVIPSAIGGALTIQIGKAVGADNTSLARFRGYAGILFGSVVSLICALCIWGMGTAIVRLYTNNVLITGLAEKLMLFVALYHIFSSVQQLSSSSLRGYKDTRTVMWVMALSLWGVALPVGYSLARTNIFTLALGVQGFWIGIVLAFCVAAVLTQLRFYKVASN